jgi:hypothetical protein
LISADFEDGSELAIFKDDVSKLCSIGGRHIRLYKKGKIRVQVVIKVKKFSFIPRIVTSRIRVGLMFRLQV